MAMVFLISMISVIEQAISNDYSPQYQTEQVNTYMLNTPLPIDIEPNTSNKSKIVPETEKVVELIEDIPEVTTFRVTAYCACEKCCGVWAKNRPLNENGEEIVLGAAGVELQHNVSVASPLPFNTQIDLGEFGIVVVHDRTAEWVVEKHGENIVDIYMADHEAAWNFGVQYLEGVVM